MFYKMDSKKYIEHFKQRHNKSLYNKSRYQYEDLHKKNNKTLVQSQSRNIIHKSITINLFNSGKVTPKKMEKSRQETPVKNSKIMEIFDWKNKLLRTENSSINCSAYQNKTVNLAASKTTKKNDHFNSLTNDISGSKVKSMSIMERSSSRN